MDDDKAVVRTVAGGGRAGGGEGGEGGGRGPEEVGRGLQKGPTQQAGCRAQGEVTRVKFSVTQTRQRQMSWWLKNTYTPPEDICMQYPAQSVT